MNTPKIADYTTRKGYMKAYAKENREAINARKRAWRAKRKLLELEGILKDDGRFPDKYLT